MPASGARAWRKLEEVATRAAAEHLGDETAAFLLSQALAAALALAARYRGEGAPPVEAARRAARELVGELEEELEALAEGRECGDLEDAIAEILGDRERRGSRLLSALFGLAIGIAVEAARRGEEPAAAALEAIAILYGAEIAEGILECLEDYARAAGAPDAAT